MQNADLLSSAQRFGWGGLGRSKQDVKEEATLVIDKQNLYFKPLPADWANPLSDQFEPLYKKFNPGNLDLSGMEVPLPSAALVEEIRRRTEREGATFLDRPGFAFLITPFKKSAHESLEWVQARLLMIEVLKALRSEEEKPLHHPDTSKHYASDKDVNEAGDFNTPKDPHYDAASRLVGHVIGPLRAFCGVDRASHEPGFRGGHKQIFDIWQALKDCGITPGQLANKLGMKPVAAGMQHDKSLLDKAFLKKLHTDYKIEFDPITDSKENIVIDICNNEPRDVPSGRGVFHGASPITLPEGLTEIEKQQLRTSGYRGFYHNRVPNNQAEWIKATHAFFFENK